MRATAVCLLICLLLASCVRPVKQVSLPSAAPPTAASSATASPGTSGPAVLLPSPTHLPTQPSPAIEPTATPAPRRSVFVISWDGARADMIYDWMAAGVLPHFASLADQGLRAEYAQSIDPPLTAAAHNALITGAYPRRTGLVSDAFHNPNDSFYWYRTGFTEPLEQVTPLWAWVSPAGLKTATVFFPGSAPGLPTQTADYTIGYGVRDAYSRQETVKLNIVSEAWAGETPASFSPPYEGSLVIPEVARLHLYVLDSRDDNTPNYDTVLLNTQRSVDADSPRLKTGEWGSSILLPALSAGADFLIQEIAAGDAPASVTLFYSNVYHNTASPRGLLQALNQQFGFFPAGADSYALEHGWITVEDDLYLLERQARWMAEVTAWVQTTYHPDLLFAYQEAFDEAGHAFLLTDTRQPGYTPERAAQYASYMQRAAQAADQALATMLQSVDLDNTTVLLVGDHGMAPIHTVVYANTILQRAGLLALDRQNYVVVERSKAFAVVSGGSVNVYINLAGDEKDGFVPPADYARIQAQIVDLFSGLTDPQTGETVFQRVLRQDELAALHLDHPNSGDVFAQAKPGYHLDGWRGRASIFEEADFYGQHGYDSTLPAMHTIFIAAGGGIPGSGQVISPVRIVDYAPTIAFWLGLTPPAWVDGEPIPALVESGR